MLSICKRGDETVGGGSNDISMHREEKRAPFLTLHAPEVAIAGIWVSDSQTQMNLCS